MWDDYRGAGVVVAVIDDGVEYTHPDLAANYRSDLDYDTVDLDADPFPDDSSDRRGAAVSGVIPAALNDGAGGAGVALEAGLVGYPWGRPDMGPFLFTRAILEGRAIDVFNHGRMQRASPRWTTSSKPCCG